MSARLTESRSIDSILQSVCEGIREALKFQKVSIDLLDRSDGRFHVRAAAGWEASDLTVTSPTSAHSISPLLDPRFEVEGCFLLDADEARTLVDSYEHAQLQALKTALLFAAFIVAAAFLGTRRLPTRRFDEPAADSDTG